MFWLTFFTIFCTSFSSFGDSLISDPFFSISSILSKGYESFAFCSVFGGLGHFASHLNVVIAIQPLINSVAKIKVA